ncbi:MAG: ribosome biogenesis GTP-binding protein YihA/YsxC [Fusobacteriaceae bacterium]|jgi:GTP-binding protein|nr:ribosome biogenesis GTP-binding protein YihA/YsxC [Fusobacteriaceae bacterium]
MLIKQADFVKSALHPKDYPEELKNMEFAFVGRSNVGKSSLINSITGRKKLAKTSKTPGRTQLINYFLINREIYFVDLPGYGFAKVSKAMKEDWNKTIAGYLESKRNKMIFTLLDIRRIPSEDDIEVLKWLDYNNIKFKIIFTKVDKLSNNERAKMLKEIKKKLTFSNDDVLFHSSLTNYGKNDVLDFIESFICIEEIDKIDKNNMQEM